MVTGNSSAFIEVCGPEQDPAWIKYANIGTAALALVVSAIAVVVAHKTFVYMRQQGQQSRADSVRDEYWLRTVVSPTCIVPLQAYVAQLPATLPTTAATVADVQAFSAATSLQFVDFSHKFRSLALIDDQLASEVDAALLELEDTVLDYAGAMAQHVSGSGPIPDKAAAEAAMSGNMVELFRLIQRHQEAGTQPSDVSRWWR